MQLDLFAPIDAKTPDSLFLPAATAREANFCSQVTSECSNPNGGREASEGRTKKKSTQTKGQLLTLGATNAICKKKEERAKDIICTISPLQGGLLEVEEEEAEAEEEAEVEVEVEKQGWICKSRPKNKQKRDSSAQQ